MLRRKILTLFAVPVFFSGPIGIFSLLAPSNVFALRFNLRLFIASIFISIVFFIVYFVTFNEAAARAGILVLVNFFLFSLVFSKLWIKSSEYIADVLYYLNLLILILAIFFTPIAVFFAKSGVSGDRVGGLIGYDFVAFFVSTYLICKIESGRIIPGFLFFVNVGLALFVVLNSGRFGFIVFIIFLLYLLNKFFSYKIFSVFFLLAIVSYILNAERLSLIFSTLYGIYDYFNTGSDLFFNSIDAGENSGFYAASPLTWIGEFNLIFQKSIDILFPSGLPVLVDSGLAYMILNSGLILALIYYILFYFFIRASGVSNVFLISIIFICDLKFRMAFSLFPMFWIYLNSAYSMRLASITRMR